MSNSIMGRTGEFSFGFVDTEAPIAARQAAGSTRVRFTEQNAVRVVLTDSTHGRTAMPVSELTVSTMP